MADVSSCGYVLVVGPDGAGKTTVVDAILSEARSRGITTTHAHSRPHVIGGRASAGSVSDPHGKPPRFLLAAVLKLVLVWADHLVGGALRWRAARREGLLLVERGWHDMVVDGRRYRLPDALQGWVRRLGRTVVRPDLTVLLGGDPDVLHARKAEIGAEEVDRQLRRWREIAPTTSTRCVEIDTTSTAPREAAAIVLDGLRRPAQSWRRVPLTPERTGLQVSGDARAGLPLYQPFSGRARLGARVGPLFTRTLGQPVAGPLIDLRGLCAELGLRPDGAVAMRSSTPGRHVVGLCRDGVLESVLKISARDDTRLEHEASMLQAALRADLPVQRPEVLWAGEWQRHRVLLTRTAQRSSPAPWTVGDVLPLVEALASAGPDGQPLVHGDLAPWNLLRTRTGPMLLDWESSRWVDEPLHDLAHFVIQGGALLNRHSPEEAAELLCAAGSPGARLLRRRGLADATAREHVLAYLSRSHPTEGRAQRFHAQLSRVVST